ncbi:MAG: hypothetical protein ABJN42_21665 [Roseibium sp.]|uniref:hypothetical protein n=1 Tax=Roseibium sp. TaxID=1936156 RepID=UPI003297D0C9
MAIDPKATQTQDERDAIALLTALVRAARKHDAAPEIKERAEKAADWLNRYQARNPSRILRTDPPISRYLPARGATLEEMRAHAQRSELNEHGDMRLVWVNEGDLFGMCLHPILMAPFAPDGFKSKMTANDFPKASPRSGQSTE